MDSDFGCNDFVFNWITYRANFIQLIEPIGLMNFIELPVFILLSAFVYLVIVYGLLKMAETQSSRGNIISHSRDNSQRIKTP